MGEAGQVQLRRNTVHLPNLPTSFDGFTILHLSDLHADMSGPAMQQVAELAPDLDYDLCVLTGDYRGRTHGDCEPCLKVVAHLHKALRGDIYGVLGNHDSIAMVPDLKALGIRMLLNECVAIRAKFLQKRPEALRADAQSSKHSRSERPDRCCMG
jgi:predicted MPP superfamily phosphohydrolase